jgi:hypothetical protein
VKIKDVIVESAYDWFSKLGQQGKQANWSTGGQDKEKYLQNYRNTLRDIDVDKIKKIHQRDDELNVDDPTDVTTPAQIPNPQEGSVLLIKANNGQEYFKAYTGQWFNKPNTDPANEFKAINPIKDPKDIESLNNQSGAGRIVPVKPTDAQYPNNWLLDQRRLKLANKSPAGKR